MFGVIDVVFLLILVVCSAENITDQVNPEIEPSPESTSEENEYNPKYITFNSTEIQKSHYGHTSKSEKRENTHSTLESTDPKFNYEEETLSKCPKGLHLYKQTSTSTICYAITEPTTFPPSCPYPKNSLQHTLWPGFSYENLKEITNETVWAYAKRDTGSGFGRFRHLNITSDLVLSYRSATNRNITRADCLIVSNSTFQAVNCEDKYPGVCVYDLGYVYFDDYCQRRYNSSCFEDYGLNSRRSCYCRVSTEQPIPRNSFCQKLAEPKEPHQNKALMDYNSNDCWIGIHKSANSSYVWSSTDASVNYTFWSPEADFAKPYSVITKTGWALQDDNSTNCAICEVDIDERLKPSLSLKYDKSSSTMELRVVNGMEMYSHAFCFADDFKTEIRLPRRGLQQQVILKVPLPSHKTLTYYWCKAMAISDFAPIYSNKILINTLRDSRRYTVKIFYPESGDPYLSRCDENACEVIRNQNVELFQDARSIMIANYDQDKGQIEVICSLTTAEMRLSITKEYERISKLLSNVGYKTENLTSSESCLESITVSGSKILHWPETKARTTAIPNEICVRQNGLPVTRTCLGDPTFGLFWSAVQGTCADVTVPDKTLALDQLLRNQDVAPEQLRTTLLSASQYTSTMTGFDIHLISKALQRMSELTKAVGIEGVVKTVNNVMHFERGTLKNSQKLLNSTDDILYNLDKALIRAKEDDSKGEIVVVTEKVLVQEINLEITTVRGIKIVVNLDDTQGFTEESLKFLRENTSEEIENDFEVAIIISNELQTEMKSCPGFSKMPSVIATVFYDDALFNQNQLSTLHSTGRIVSLLAPGFACDLGTPIKVVFKSSSTATQQKCAFWKHGYNEQLESVHGLWTIESNPRTLPNSSYQICEFTRLAHFSLLARGQSGTKRGGTDVFGLNLMSATGSGLSVLGLLVVLITAVVYKGFYPYNGIFVNYTLVIIGQIGALYLADNATEYDILCKLSSAVLFYIVWVHLLWMVFIVLLQFRDNKYVADNLPRHLTTKLSITCWCIPLVPVTVVGWISVENYAKNTFGMCYANGYYFFYGVLSPICTIIFLKVIMLFGIPLWNSKKLLLGMNPTENGGIIARIRLALMLFYLLGLTWIFGLLSAGLKQIIYTYLFSLTAAFQGFVSFLYLIILNPRMRRLWFGVLCFKRKPNRRKNGKSAVHIPLQIREEKYKGEKQLPNKPATGKQIVRYFKSTRSQNV